MELKESILKLLEEKNIKHKNISDLAHKVGGILKAEYDETLRALKELESEGEIFEFVRNRFAVSKALGVLKGKLSMATNNFGFVLRDDGDIFVAKRDLLRALDGDIVLVKVLSKGINGKKREGKIVKILSRDCDKLVGEFRRIKSYGYVDLDKKNVQVFIPSNFTMGAQDEDKVVVDITEYKAGNPVGKVVEVIGNIQEPGNDIKYLLRQYKVDDRFSDGVLDQARSFGNSIDKDKYKNRVDLTSTMLFTIDGKDAKDLDDAISLEKHKNGSYTLGVHIADVGEYVTLDSPIDEEAFKRGTSVYFLNSVIPMLPKELSNGICSLNEGVDRLALSVIMDIDAQGNVTDSKICESIIKSKHRLNYDEVQSLLDGDKELATRYSDISKTLFDMLELSRILIKRRENYGMLDFNLPEGVVIVDKDGKPVDVVKRMATPSTRIIESFMVIANEVIAKTFSEKKIPFVYRVHENPDVDKITNFVNFLSTLGVSAKLSTKKEIEPKDLQHILGDVKDKPFSEVVNMVMLRSLKKAKYMEKNLGHFGMALQNYCHFTSPIRRYPDLTIHRIIKKWLHENITEITSPKMAGFVVKASVQSSNQEKVAEDVERAITDYKKCEYMGNFIGSEFDGIISGVNSRGFYVELENTCEGFVGVSTLKDDFYDYDERTLSLVSKNNYFKIGEKVRIKVTETNPKERKTLFDIVKKL